VLISLKIGHPHPWIVTSRESEAQATAAPAEIAAELLQLEEASGGRGNL
jgi:hypothetical protein